MELAFSPKTLRFINWQYSSLVSSKIEFLPNRSATTPVVPDPANGSRTVSPGLVLMRMAAVTSAVHDRMPVILDPDNYDLWLDPGMNNAVEVSHLLKPYDARLMRCYPISTRINRVANDDEQCSAPVELAQTQNRLFS